MLSRATLASVLVGVSAEPSWTEFKSQHGRVYTSQEESSRRAIFEANVKIIEEVNSKGLPYRFGVNHLSDWTEEEYRGLFGYIPRNIPETNHLGTHSPNGVAPLPSIDWVAKGAVTPVKNQGQCGSCWSFSTTGGLEGAWFVATKKLVELSEQELVDCSHNGNNGCNGGLMDYAFTFLESHNVCTESGYPYHASDGSCKLPCANPAIPRGGVTGYKDVRGEVDLLSAIQDRPISIAVDAESGWQSYQGGVLTSECGQQLDHGVLAVGYGKDGANDYWKIKNSWGTGWGEKGYIRILRGINACGIGNSASYPLVDGSAPPTPPSPTPPSPTPPSPDECKDVFPDCDILKDICSIDQMVARECKKTCGCCVTDNKPPYCTSDETSSVVV